MRLNIVKSKNAEQLYIIKSYRENGKSTSKIVEKLGNMDSLLPLHDNDREQVIAWAKEQARIMTEAEKDGTLRVSIPMSEAKQIEMNEKLLFNAGYLFLQKTFYELGLDKICTSISNRRQFEFNLTDILSRLIYNRIIHPSSKRSSFAFSKELVEAPKHELHQIYRALDILSEESDFIQSEVYLHSRKNEKRNTSILYYDCTNYFFEIEEESELCKYGHSKEHRPNPIVQMGLFLDGDGIPLAFQIFAGNENEQPSLIPLEKQIIKDFSLSRFIVCTDAGLASAANRKFNTLHNRSYVVTQSIKVLKKHLKEWALDPSGWKISGENKLYDLSQMDESIHANTVFYKERWINENGLEQRLIVNFSLKYRNYQRTIRGRQIERAEKIIHRGKSAKTRNPNSPDRFIDEMALTTDGEIAEQLTMTLNTDRIIQEEEFDGFSAICTTLEDDASEIVKINHRRWEIESAFRVMKSEFKSRPVYVRNTERIKAHFLTCYLSLLVLRVLEKKLGQSCTTEGLIKTLRSHALRKINGTGFIPAFERTEITDRLHDIMGFRTDSEIISNKTMKKILKTTKG